MTDTTLTKPSQPVSAAALIFAILATLVATLAAYTTVAYFGLSLLCGAAIALLGFKAVTSRNWVLAVVAVLCTMLPIILMEIRQPAHIAVMFTLLFALRLATNSRQSSMLGGSTAALAAAWLSAAAVDDYGVEMLLGAALMGIVVACIDMFERSERKSSGTSVAATKAGLIGILSGAFILTFTATAEHFDGKLKNAYHLSSSKALALARDGDKYAALYLLDSDRSGKYSSDLVNYAEALDGGLAKLAGRISIFDFMILKSAVYTLVESAAPDDLERAQKLAVFGSRVRINFGMGGSKHIAGDAQAQLAQYVVKKLKDSGRTDLTEPLLPKGIRIGT